jgi:hypothetical protein
MLKAGTAVIAALQFVAAKRTGTKIGIVVAVVATAAVFASAALAYVAHDAPSAVRVEARTPYPTKPADAIAAAYRGLKAKTVRSCTHSFGARDYELLAVVKLPNGTTSQTAFEFINTAGFWMYWKDNLALDARAAPYTADGFYLREQFKRMAHRLQKACHVHPLPDPWYRSVASVADAIQFGSRIPLPEGNGGMAEVKRCSGMGTPIWGPADGAGWQYSDQALRPADREAHLYRSVGCRVIAHVDSRVDNNPFYSVDVRIDVTGKDRWDGKVVSEPVEVNYCPPSYQCG